MLDIKIITIISNKIKLIYQEWIYGGHLLSLGAVSVVWVSAILLEIGITWDILLAVYLFVEPIYSYDRLRGLQGDFLTNPQRSEYITSKAGNILFMIYFYITAFVFLLLYFDKIKSLFFGLTLLFLGFLYHKFFKQITKRIVAFKNVFVAFFWVSFVIFLIVYYSVSPDNLGLFLILIYVFVKTFIMQIYFDIKDIDSDSRDKLLTIPVVFGKYKTIQIINILTVLIVIPLLVGIYLNVLPVYTLFLLLLVPYNIYFFQQTKKQEQYHHYLFVGSEYLLWLLLIFIGKNLM